MQTQDPILVTKHVTKEILVNDVSNSILKNITMTVNKAEIIAITGRSGVGKTTLLSLLAGLDIPTSGTIKLMGHDISKLCEDERARLRLNNIGFVFQNFHLIPSLTVLENVMLPLELSKTRNAQERSQEILSYLGLKEKYKCYPNQLSGGEQQRVALARAYVIKPSILFADELTGNLDEATSSIITKLLFDLNEKEKTTLILVTHDQTLANNCQRQLELRGGEIVEK